METVKITSTFGFEDVIVQGGDDLVNLLGHPLLEQLHLQNQTCL